MSAYNESSSRWWLRLWQALEPLSLLDAEARDEFERYRLQHHLGYLRVILPLLLLGHLGAAGYFSWLPRASWRQVLWLDALVRLHGVAAAFVAVVLFAVTASPSEIRAAAWRVGLFEALLRFYPLFGALVSANAQRAHSGYGFFVFCAMASALATTGARSALVVNLGAAALLAVAIVRAQPDPALRGAAALTVLCVGALAFLWSRITVHLLVQHVTARRSERVARDELERRVREQTREIVEQMEQIARLNLQLDAQVQQRSRELSLALARIAEGAGSVRALEVGAIVGSRFVVEAPMNQRRSVWLADDRVTGSRVVLRVAQASSTAELDELRRALAEIDALTDVREPVFVRTVFVDLTSDGCLLQALEYAPGKPLDRWLDDEGSLPAAIAARLGALLAKGLAAAHERAVVHRSLAPHNVMLSTFSPGVRLLGFGSARVVQQGYGGPSTLLAGIDPEYVAPESIADGVASSASDVYALGLVMYRAIAGRAPFRPTSGAGWLRAHLEESPIALGECARAVPAALDAAVMRCLEKDPAARPTAITLSAELERVANDLGAEGVDGFVRSSLQ
jgi:hypothetical protein